MRRFLAIILGLYAVVARPQEKHADAKAEELVEKVRARLKELNPEFDTDGLKAEIVKGEVVKVTLPTGYVKTIDPLVAFRKLEWLSVATSHGRMSKVSDLSSLRGLPLKYLDATGTAVADLGPLKDMALESLYLQNTKVKDIRLLKDMPLKQVVIPAGVPGKQLDVLKGKELTLFGYYGVGPDQKQFETLFTHAQLWLFRTMNTPEITNLEPLRGMPLTHLELPNAPKLRDTKKARVLEPLKKMSAVQINNAQIADLSPLADQPIGQLDLTGCTLVKDISPIAKNPNLRSIWLGKTGVTDLGPLAHASALVELVVPPRVKSLKPLSELPLTTVEMRGSVVEDGDMTPLAKLPLKDLRLDERYLSPAFLKQLPKLEYLNLKKLDDK